jgi:hypothetical protein
LTCFFPAGEINVHDSCGHDASVAFYWPNQQYYVSGHDDHPAEPPPPVLPSTENVQVKKYQILARHANANFLASMDPLVCPILNLAVYVEMSGT